jgi:hypothetical protein
MILFEMYGGPGSGKSVASAALYVALKNVGIRASLVNEAATELILSDAKAPCYDNQLLIAGMQWERTLRLQRHCCAVAISDSPLIQGLMYMKESVFPNGNSPVLTSYKEELRSIIRKLEKEFETLKVYVRRATPYDEFGRNQNTEEAKLYDAEAYLLGAPFWIEIDGNEKGQLDLIKAVKRNFALENIVP